MHIFTLEQYWWFYAAFTGFVLLLLLLDLGVFHRKAHAVSFKEAAGWSVVWIALALTFNYVFYLYCLQKFENTPELATSFGKTPQELAHQFGLEFLTGYLIEKALSVDNIFVFVIIFRYFAIPAEFQHRVLFFGILGALVFRAIFIALGSVLMSYSWVIVLFGIFLIVTGAKLIFSPEKQIEPENNVAIRILKRFFPISPRLNGQKFFIKENGVRLMTPLFVALAVVEFTDIIFALDSVPAIFAITREPLIVFTSNVFAILGLRALYFLLAGVMDKFHLLKYGLGAVLIFVGLKMTVLDHFFDGHFPITLSLGIIGAILALSVILSFIIPPKHDPVS